jgi:hypothetical protein
LSAVVKIGDTIPSAVKGNGCTKALVGVAALTEADS